MTISSIQSLVNIAPQEEQKQLSSLALKWNAHKVQILSGTALLLTGAVSIATAALLTAGSTLIVLLAASTLVVANGIFLSAKGLLTTPKIEHKPTIITPAPTPISREEIPEKKLSMPVRIVAAVVYSLIYASPILFSAFLYSKFGNSSVETPVNNPHQVEVLIHTNPTSSTLPSSSEVPVQGASIGFMDYDYLDPKTYGTPNWWASGALMTPFLCTVPALVSLKNWVQSNDPMKTSPKATLPVIGVLGGVSMGTVLKSIKDGIPSNFAETLTNMDHKNNLACKNHKSMLNSFKQWEISKFAPLTALVPLAVNIIHEAYKNPGNHPGGVKGIAKRLYAASKNQLTPGQCVFLVTLVSLAMFNPIYAEKTGLKSLEFNSSGHLMMKGTIAAMLSHLIANSSNNVNLTFFAQAWGLAYAVTDAMFIQHTAAICHTAKEVLAGIGWSLGIYGLATGTRWTVGKIGSMTKLYTLN